MGSAVASNTSTAYERIWRNMATFLHQYCMPTSLPLPVSTIAVYISFLFAQGKSPKTISTYLSAISFLHKVHCLPDPTKAFLIQKLVAGAYKLKPTTDLRLPITKPILQSLVSALESTLHGYNRSLFQAMFVFAFYTYARIGELTVATSNSPYTLSLQDVSFTSIKQQLSQVRVTFRHFKHNTKGQPHNISFRRTQSKYCPVMLLAGYLRKRGAKEGALFCDPSGAPVLRHAFDSILREALSFCGLAGKCYKGHSFRIGKASSDAEMGVPDSIIRLRGRWKSDAFKKYIRVLTN